jgi:hypothetical protein
VYRSGVNIGTFYNRLICIIITGQIAANFVPKRDSFEQRKSAKKGGKWQRGCITGTTAGADKECLTFGAAIDKNWRSPVAKAA